MAALKDSSKQLICGR